MFLMLYCIKWPNSIAWLPLFLEMLVNMCIAIVFFPGCDVTNFEINLIFLLFTKSRQNFEYLENKKNFSGEIKSF